MNEFFKLKESHPTYQKVLNVFDLLDKLGLTITHNSYGGLVITDKDFPNIYFRLQDIDNPEEPIDTIPHSVEYRIIYKK